MQAGVRTIEHGDGGTPEIFALMAYQHKRHRDHSGPKLFQGFAFAIAVQVAQKKANIIAEERQRR